MINKDFKKAIKIITERLKKNRIKWAVIGSTNLALQGMRITPRDLDVVVTLSDLKNIPKIFSEYPASRIKKLKSITEEPAWEVKIEIGDVKVQILGEKESGEYVNKLLKSRITYLEVDGIKVPCFTLETEADAYSETNREEKAKLIKKFLKS